MAAAHKRESQTLSQWPQKRTKRLRHHNTNGTVGSNLPDDILENIFSFLPIKHAVRIGVLSTRFKNSWLFNRNLRFDREFARSRGRGEFIEIVNRVLNSHAGSKIRSLQLYFDPNGTEFVVENWIRISIEKGAEELDLDFYQGSKPFKLPSQFLDVESIRILKLTYCEVVLPPKLNGLGFLSTLVLKKVDLTSELIETLFNHCSLLETLDLWQCNNIRHLKICARNLKNFKVLKVGHCLDIELIDIDAPTLRLIYYTGNILKFKFAEVLKLNEALLNFMPSRAFIHASQVENLVSDLSHVNVLSTTSTFLEGLTARIRSRNFREMQFCFWNLKEFQLFMEGTSYCNLYDIASFLKNCPCLEKLFIDLNEFSFECGMYWELHQKQILENFQYFFSCLKFIKVKGFKFQKHELELVRLLLGKAIILESLVLVTPRNGRIRIYAAEAHVLLYSKLLFSWRASPTARIVIYEHFNDKSFVHPKHSKFWN